MKESKSIGIVVFLIFIFCAINMALGDPPEEMPEQSQVQKADKYVRSTHTQKRVQIHMVTAPEDSQIINAGSLGNIVEIQNVPKNGLCNVLLVAPENDLPYGEATKKGPAVSNSKLTEAWGKEGNAWPVKISGAKHPLPEFYWNVLLSGEMCKLAADEPDYYLASNWEQLIALPAYIKEDIIKVKVLVEEDGKDVEKIFFWGDPEIQNAKSVLYMIFPHQWSGRENDLGIIDPELLKYRSLRK